uniref:Uncharacterized protein n=1 Tax=Solanum lycopersicum TaxID=4081 RepID=A0A3Q7FPF8_SOLLC
MMVSSAYAKWFRLSLNLEFDNLGDKSPSNAMLSRTSSVFLRANTVLFYTTSLSGGAKYLQKAKQHNLY